MDLTFISLLRVLQKRAAVFVRTAGQCVRSICILTPGRDWTRLLDWGQSCSKTVSWRVPI